MAMAASVLPLNWAAADLHDHLGLIPLHRIRLYPPLGTTALADVLTVQAQENRFFNYRFAICLTGQDGGGSKDRVA